MDLNKLVETLSILDDYQKTNYIIDQLNNDLAFTSFSKNELQKIKKRDYDDSQFLKKGIKIAVQNGLRKDSQNSNHWIRVDVDNKTPDEIVAEIQKTTKLSHGTVLAISGNSGVGKGTIVNTIKKHYENCLIWSNGDLFRSIAYLSRKKYPVLIQNRDFKSVPFNRIAESINITDNGEIFIRDGDNIENVGDIKVTKLKSREIEEILPDIATYSQKMVIEKVNTLFKLNNKQIILVEGRKETLDLIFSTAQIELVTTRELMVGKRRAAQKILAKLVESQGVHKDLQTLIQELDTVSSKTH